MVDGAGRPLRIVHVEGLDGDVVTSTETTANPDGTTLRADRARPRFLDADSLDRFLADAGFAMASRHGGWAGEPFTASSATILTSVRAVSDGRISSHAGRATDPAARLECDGSFRLPRWNGPYFPPPTEQDADDAVTRISSQLDIDEWPGVRWRLVIADRLTNLLVGTVSWHWESKETDWPRAGMTVFDPSMRGRGVGTEALALWADYLFTATAFRRLDFSTWSGNLAMCGVGAKLGWTEEARFRDARVVRGTVYDSVVYGVTRVQWESRHLHSDSQSANY
ncbi:GNAT family N-acetyltransferase [Arthrobacter sp. Hz1]